MEMLRLGLVLAKAKFKLKNERSYLGLIWYILNPILLFTLLFLIFNDRIGNNIPYYSIYLLMGVILFNFFQSCTNESTRIIIDNREMIRSVKFKHESLVLSNIINYLLLHIVEIIILLILIVMSGINLMGLAIYPIVLIFFCLFVYGISLMVSALTIYFPDLEQIWRFFIGLLWFATPIFYEIGGQTRLLILNQFNPLYYFITLTREIIIYNQIPELNLILGAILYTGIALFLGILIFNKLKKNFAENM